MTVKRKDPKTTVRRMHRVADVVPPEPTDDYLAVEEPLEIRINDGALTVTMRTPGDDFELAAGFLFNEGILREASQIGTIRYCDSTENPELRNIVNVTFSDGHKVDTSRLKRNFYSSSSCGVCGKTAIDQVRVEARPVNDRARVKVSALFTLVDTLRRAQTVFNKTGGLHAAGIFDTNGTLLVVREDIGRHNAVDKVIGACFLRQETPLNDHILMVSGRASFEVMQKAMMASIPIVCAISAPSSLAVQLASECGMTLVGFLRGSEMNVYSGAGRIMS